MDIKYLSPFSKVESLSSFDAKKEFNELSVAHKAVTILATGVIGLFTLFIAAPKYFKMLVGRLRKMELNESTPQAAMARRVHEHRPVHENVSDSSSTTSGSEETQSSQELQPEALAQSYEGGFWEEHFRNSDLQRVLEMVFTNCKNEEEAAEFIVSHYESYKKQNDPAFVIEDDQKDLYIRAVKKQFLENEPVNSGVSRTEKLENGKVLRIYNTVGDGSCGLHAMLGKDQNGIYRCDAKKARREFCDWIREKNKQGHLPQRIENVLDDYFLNFDMAPSSFREAVRSKRQGIFKGYKDLSPDEQDRKKREFREDKEVLNAYLKNLEKVDTYLLQDELIAAAECFNKELFLYQPGWGNDTNIGRNVFNSGAEEEVHIWYNGFNHYERAGVS